MSDVLSQAEIDALLASIETGEAADEKKEDTVAVRGYDFRTANRFTKEHIRAINMIFKNFCHLLSNYLMGTLRASSEVEVLSLEEMSFNEFHNSVPSPVVLAIINIAPLGGPVILEISTELVYSIVGRVLGGTKGVSADGRQFADVELAITERVIWQMLRSLDEAWEKMMTIDSTLDRVETSMQFAQIVDMNEPILMVTMNVTVGEENGLLGFCLPQQTLEPFTKRLNSKTWYTGNSGKKVEAHPDDMMRSLSRTAATLSVVFRDTQASVHDILSMQVGDVIQLNHRADEPLVVKVEHIPKFHATMGRYRNACAVKIVDIIKGERET